MDAHFHDSHALSKDDLAALLPRSDHPALGRFAIQFGLLLASASLVVAAPAFGLPWWIMASGLLTFALMSMGMFALVHESGHHTAFGSRWLNGLVLWLAGAPIYYTPTGFREFHFAHHRWTQDPGRDPEISVAGKPVVGMDQRLLMYLGYLTGLPLLLFKIAMVIAGAVGAPVVWTKLLTFVTPRSRPRVIWEGRLVVLLHGLWIAAGLLWLPGLLWLLLGQVLGHALLSFYLVAEHTGRPHEGSILERTRTTVTHPLIRWLMWNMPYHAEHHAYPAVPWHALPALHERLEPELCRSGRGYASFHRRALASLSRGRPFSD